LISFNNAGNLLRKLKRFNEALEVFKNAIKIRSIPQLYNNMGNVYLDMVTKIFFILLRVIEEKL
jgi:hypothetical protein